MKRRQFVRNALIGAAGSLPLLRMANAFGLVGVLYYSTTPDYANPVALEGANVFGTIYISQVGGGGSSESFYLDGVLVNTDSGSPWQMNPLDTSTITAGSHMITVKNASGTLLAQATFTVGILIGLPTDGSDVTDSFNAQIASAPDGARLAVPPGQYHMEGTCRMSGRTGLVLEALDPANRPLFYALAPGPLDQQAQSNRKHFYADGCSNITWRNLLVRGPNVADPNVGGYATYVANYEMEHGFHAKNCVSVLVEDCEADHIYGDGFSFGGGGSPTSGAIVRRGKVSWNGRQGISLSNTVDSLLDGVAVQNSRRSGIDLEPTQGMESRRNEIKGCTVNSHLVPFSSGGKGPASDIYIHDNTITSYGRWLYCAPAALADGTVIRRANWRVENNIQTSFAKPPQPVTIFGNTDGIRLVGNTIPVGDRSGEFVEFTSCHASPEIPELRVEGNVTSPSGQWINVRGSTLPEEVTNLNNTSALTVRTVA